MEHVDHLIFAKWIVTCDENNRVLENHALLLKDGKIYALIPDQEAKAKYTAKHVTTYKDHAFIPGFINTHTHLAMNLFRGLADDLSLMDWLNNYIWPAEGKWLSHDLVYDGTLLAIAEMIRGGITCFNDMYFFPEATADAAIRSGIRAHIGMTILDFPTPFAKTPAEYFAKGLAFYAAYRHHPFITATIAPHSTYSVSLDNLIRVKEIQEKYQLKVNIHLQEAPEEMDQVKKKHEKRPLHLLNEIGLVSPDLIAIHMTQVDESDIQILKEKQPSIVHCPQSNMKLVSGFCPVYHLAKNGINVALGTDGAASNNDLDMFGEIQSAAFLGKVTANDPKALPSSQTLKMATLHGAKALGIDKMTGSLTVGKSADIVAIDLDRIETQPLYHPISQIVYATSREQVQDVWIAGKQVLKNRELVTLDEEELRHKAKIWGEKIRS